MSVFQHPEVPHAYQGGRPTFASAALMLTSGVPIAVLGGILVGKLLAALVPLSVVDTAAAVSGDLVMALQPAAPSA
jgi:hypothetical protein